MSESHLKYSQISCNMNMSKAPTESYQTGCSESDAPSAGFCSLLPPLGTQPVDSTCFIRAKLSEWTNHGPQGGMNQDWVLNIMSTPDPI